MDISEYYDLFRDAINISTPETINENLKNITSQIDPDSISVSEKVDLSNFILQTLSYDQRKQLASDLIQEQVIDQKDLLDHWSIITAQSSIIDTGYIAQHLVSLQTQIAGQGMRGKGVDLCDGSEIKAANFLGSQDKKGAKEPRWNFPANTIEIMERFLDYNAIFLLSIDLNPQRNIRIRIWEVDIQRHTILRNRYREWMDQKGYPKFEDNERPSVNFQLFPPNNQTDDNFARHGNNRANGFPQLNIPLEDTEGSSLIFQAEVINNHPEISIF